MKRLLLFIAMVATFSLLSAQVDSKEKFSITTRLFLNELKDGGFDPMKQEARRRARKALLNPNLSNVLEPMYQNKSDCRFYAAPDTINGCAYISAFIRLEDNNDISELEALGVQVQCKFQEGIITSEIPVDKIADVAALSNVKNIEVAEIMQPCTNVVRDKTNVDDILTLSIDAIRAGIDTKYDGKGILLGIIDRGIDFQHIAFKDKDGKSRIEKGYIYDGKEEHDYDKLFISEATTDDVTEDHGTHTASIAGGSSVIINGSSITVTDEHANSTYGGVAPGTDLFLCGLNDLKTTYIGNAFKRIVSYADRMNVPVVVSNSYGNMSGPHNGRSGLGSIISQYFNDNNPNHICLFSSGNNVGHSQDNEGGGIHVYGEGSKSNPLGTIIRQPYYSNFDAGSHYYGMLAYACPRYSCTPLECKIYVLDSSSGAILTTISITNSGIVSGLDDYYNGDLYVELDDEYVVLYTNDGDFLETKKQHKVSKQGYNNYYASDYTLAFEIYPKTGSVALDIWGHGKKGVYFTNHLRTEGHKWTAGSDDMSVDDYATCSNVISVGAYVSRNVVIDYRNQVHSLSDKYTLGDIAPFSSYATADQSPTGEFYPWITAPGATVISAVNHFHTNGGYLDNSFEASDMYRVNSSTTNPYGNMDGTSMACPVVAGIVALWLQAAKEVGLALNTSDVKRIMANTAIRDDYVTNGKNSTHFGNGKIDALAGIKEILLQGKKSSINVLPTELTFYGAINQTLTKTINVKGMNINGEITATLNDESGYFSIDNTRFIPNAEGVDITVTWIPTNSATVTSTITLSAEGVDDVVVTLIGQSEFLSPELSTSTKQLVFSGMPGDNESQQFILSGKYIIDDVSLTLKDDNGVFSVNTKSISAANMTESFMITVNFHPSKEGSFFATLTISSGEANDMIVSLSGVSNDNGTLVNYQYWFDDDYAHRKTMSINSKKTTVNTDIETDQLSNGIHRLNFRVKRNDGKYSSVNSTQFLKIEKEQQGHLDYWIDDNFENVRSLEIQDTEDEQSLILDFANCSLGYHKLSMKVATPGSVMGSVQTVGFLKLDQSDASRLEYWFDNDIANKQTLTGRHAYSSDDYIYTEEIDMSGLSPGLHRLNFRAVSSVGFTMGSIFSCNVLKLSKSKATQLEYWFDDDVENKVLLDGQAVSDGFIIDNQLDLSGLSFGLHRLNFCATSSDGTNKSSLITCVVMKTGSGPVTKLQYWFDGDFSKRRTISSQAGDGLADIIFANDLNISGISPGHHRLFYRGISDNGLTSTAISSTPVLVKINYGNEGDATMASYSLIIDNDSVVSSGSMSATKEAVLNYTLDTGNLKEGTHTLRTTFWNSYGACITDLTSFVVLPRDFLLGDVNRDGKVNITDAVCILNYILGNTPSTFFFKAADINKDAIINITDVVGVMNIIMNGNKANSPRQEFDLLEITP